MVGPRKIIGVGENISRMLHLGQGAQTDHAVLSRPAKLPSQLSFIEQPMNVKKETIENALN